MGVRQTDRGSEGVGLAGSTIDLFRFGSRWREGSSLKADLELLQELAIDLWPKKGKSLNPGLSLFIC